MIIEYNTFLLQVSYVNHSKFNSEKSKLGSVVRIFTNIDLRYDIYAFCCLMIIIIMPTLELLILQKN